MEESLLSIIKYIFQKKKQNLEDETFQSFFENGISFPRFVQIILDINCIENIDPNPQFVYQKQKNNDISLRRLLYSNPIPIFQQDRSRINLMKTILTNCCFTMTICEITSKLNSILKSKNIQIESENEIFNPKILMALLNVLSNSSTEVSDDISIDILISYLTKLKIPVVINESSFLGENNFTILIQIEIIFDAFSEKIDRTSNTNKSNTSDGEKIDFQSWYIDPNFDDTNKHKRRSNSVIENDLLLTTLKKISCYYGEIFHDFECSYKSGVIPQFMSLFFDRKEIEKFGIKMTTCSKSDSFNNVIRIIDFLKTKDKIFNLLEYKFDFFSEREGTFIFFFKRFLNSFFLTKSRKELIDRCFNLLSRKCYQYGTKTFIDISHKKTFYCLLQFYILGHLDFQCPEDSDISYSQLQELFLKSGIPMVINSNILHMVYEDNVLPDPVCYQLQFIFDRLDYAGCPYKIVEMLAYKITLIEKIRVPSSIVIMSSIKAKQASINFAKNLGKSEDFQVIQSYKEEKNLNEEEEENHSDDDENQQENESSEKSINNEEESNKNEEEDLVNGDEKEKFEEEEEENKEEENKEEEENHFEVENENSNEENNEEDDLDINDNEGNDRNDNDEDENSNVDDNDNDDENSDEDDNDDDEDSEEEDDSEKKEEEEEEEEEANFQMDEIEKFWNPNNNSYEYDNGILIVNNNQSNEECSKTISDYNKILPSIEKSLKKITKKHQKSDDQLSVSNSSNNIETKVYKIFQYDEIKYKWTFNSSVFNQFATDKHINLNKSKTPLIFYINTNKTDLIKMGSHLVTGLYPNLENEEDIFVYPLCERSLSILNVVHDFVDKKKASIKPIILMIHIPKSKEKVLDIETILIQIYSFLSFICDISVAILDQKHINQQIGFYQKVLKITNYSYQKVSLSSEVFIEDDVLGYLSDSDGIAEEDLNDNDTAKLTDSFIYKKNHILFLLNNEKVEPNMHSNSIFKKSSFLKNLRKKLSKKLRCYLINLDNFETYKEFFDKVTKICLSETSTFSEVKTNFQCFTGSGISGMYVHIKNLDSSWKEELKKVVQNRFSMLESMMNSKQSHITLLSQLRRELSTFSPKYDTEYVNEYNSILSSMKYDFNKENREKFELMLRKSSDSNLKAISKMINEKAVLSDELKEIIKNSHTQFLNDEFLNIIKSVVNDKMFVMIYQDNIDLLQGQIDNDKEKFEELFKISSENNSIKQKIEKSDLQEESKKKTNYVLKETENLREIKIEVELGKDLTSLIEQDF